MAKPPKAAAIPAAAGRLGICVIICVILLLLLKTMETNPQIKNEPVLQPATPQPAPKIKFLQKPAWFDFILEHTFAVTIGIFIILSFFVVIFVILPSIQEINRLNQQISVYKTELEKKYQERFSVRQTITDLEKAKKIVPSLNPAFISKDGEIDFVEMLENIADKNNLTLQLGLRALNSNHNKFLSPFEISLTLEGGFANDVKYLEELEKQNTYINIQDILIYKKSAVTLQIKGTVWKMNE